MSFLIKMKKIKAKNMTLLIGVNFLFRPVLIN